MNLVNWRGSNLATIVSGTLQSQDGRIRCLVDRSLEFFLTSHAQFLFIFSEACTTGMVWELTSLRHYGNKVLTLMFDQTININ